MSLVVATISFQGVIGRDTENSNPQSNPQLVHRGVNPHGRPRSRWQVMRYRVSEDAERDLDEIFLYWARASLETADRVLDRITERFWLLGEYPDAGKPAGGIAPGVKCFPAGKYLIYYRKTRHGTDILHSFHGARNQGSGFKTPRKRR